MDSLVFRCPGCQQPFQVLAEQAGQVVRCPGCEDAVQIPAASTPPSQASSSTAVSPKPRGEKVEPKSKPKVETGAGAINEEVQAYGCPKCEKPFGIFASMFGSEMACPHCQETVLLKPSPKPPQKPAVKPAVKPPSKPAEKQAAKSPATVASSPIVKSPPKPKVPIKTQGASESTPPKLKSQSKLQPIPKPTVSPAQNVGAPPGPVMADGSGQAENIPTKEVQEIDETAAAPVVEFVAQSVDHLLPPKFAAVDPAFFYRRHQDGSQVLLPSEDGSVEVVDNRIVRIEHNGQTYDLISSPEYDRMQKMVVNNLLAVLICGLLIAIVMTLLNG